MLNKEMTEYITYLMGAPFIKGYNLLSKNHLQIMYYGEFDEFINDKPDSNLTKEDFDSYFNENETTKKLMVSESVRLLRQFPFLECVTIDIRENDKVKTEVHSLRSKLNEYLGYKIEDLSVNNGSWHEAFVSEYLQNPQKIDELFELIECKMRY
ncbi:hypothetical protein P8917_09230 [Bacillus atrophaeus]|uniref:hypothetical protein n=1 Tax=Bacillus atrophaeus TaxID=1452 RepID=UPI00227F2746|nr:hypothetical protein [Bacillus atrophaeus]MCY8499822.1 hypothetical protein [Bacillus atrophaeus]MCY8815022.1 hypothetical protein [Bacillus atrophaeus]MCY8823072.1 hypothetical protein [Bacillus atrophaeus]MCY8831297.1 hypothetical protein [Bacillus atrophaeus]MCY8834903.1 hypothetical protein [Bacillus atrophaeus]